MYTIRDDYKSKQPPKDLEAQGGWVEETSNMQEFLMDFEEPAEPNRTTRDNII